MTKESAEKIPTATRPAAAVQAAAFNVEQSRAHWHPAAQHALLSLVSSLATSRNLGVVFVTHEISAAAGFASRVVLLDAAKGWVETGPAQQLVSSQNMTRLYGRPVEVRYENGRALVWLAANATEAAP